MTIQQPPTLEEFLAWPERKPYLEFIHGEVRQKAMPNAAHSYLQAELAGRLRDWRKYRQGFTLTEQRCILKAQDETHTMLPDVAWFTPEQLPALPDGSVRVPPTLAIEIVSPDDSYSDVQDKALAYLDCGVLLVWVVDPRARKVSIYRPGTAPDVVGSTEVLIDKVLPGLEISLSDLFSPLPSPPQPRLEH